MRRCEHCTKPITTRKAKRYCCRTCYHARIRRFKDCAWCGKEFHCKVKRQICCSYSCGNSYGYHRSGTKRASMKTALAARRMQQHDAIMAKLKGMTPIEIYRFAVARGRQTLWFKLIRSGIIERGQLRKKAA